MKNFIMSAEIDQINKQNDTFVHVIMSDLVNHEINDSSLFVSLDLEHDLTDKIKPHGGRHPLPEASTFIEKMFEKNLYPDDNIIIFSERLMAATRLWWMLKETNYQHIKVWLDPNKQLIGSIANHSRKKVVKTRDSHPPLPSMIAYNHLVNYQQVVKAIGDENTLLIDVRHPDRYNGLVEPLDKIAGHIPSAKNYFFEDAYQKTGIIKSRVQLEQQYAQLRDYHDRIVYCGSGISATAFLIAVDEIGIECQLYAGSFSDYISYKQSLIITK